MTTTSESVGEILKRVCERTRWGRRVSESRALDLWAEVVGESLRQHSRPRRVRDGRLVVAVEDAVWKQEITLLGADILRRLNERMGGDRILEIVLVVE